MKAEGGLLKTLVNYKNFKGKKIFIHKIKNSRAIFYTPPKTYFYDHVFIYIFHSYPKQTGLHLRYNIYKPVCLVKKKLYAAIRQSRLRSYD